MQLLVKVIHEYVDAYRRKNLDVMAGLYSEGATLSDPQAALLVSGTGGELRERREILEYYRQQFRALPHDPRLTLDHTIVHRPWVVAEILDQKRRFCHLFEIHNERIVRHRIYWGSLPSKFVLDKLLRIQG